MMETPTPMAADSQDIVLSTGATAPDQMPLEDFGNEEGLDPPVPVDSSSGLEAVQDVPVTIQAVLGRSRIAIGALMQLKANAVIELDRRVGEPVDIFVNNRLIARGEVVLIENSLGVTLTEIVRQER